MATWWGSSPASSIRQDSPRSAASASRSPSTPRRARWAYHLIERLSEGLGSIVNEQIAVPPDTGRLLFEIKKVIVGQDHLLERILVGLLARGHLLVEGVPGLAKTLSVKTVTQAITGDFKLIQFTPDPVHAHSVGAPRDTQRP